MANISKNYLDLSKLQSYDGQLKTYIAGEDAKAYKTILLSSDGKNIYFYKKDNATLSDTANFSIDLEAITSESYVPSINGHTLIFRAGTTPST